MTLSVAMLEWSSPLRRKLENASKTSSVSNLSLHACWNGASVVSIVFDSLHILHIFNSELLDDLLPIENSYIMGGVGGGGGGAPYPWGRRHWVGIHFCHREVVKLQQRFFFLGEGECQYILETATGELEGKMKMTIQ